MPPRPKSKRPAPLPVAIKDHKQVATRPVMLLVLGPHRSGTSLTARMLECLGAENSRNQLPPQPDNPSGFFEDSDVYDFGESVLLPKLQRRWDSVSPTDWSVLSKSDRSRLGLQALEIIRRNYPLSNPLSVLKEPRINNTLPFWLSLLEHAGFDVRVVCAVRDPVSVARSLEKRNHFSLAHGGMIYLSAWLSILPHLQERQVSFVQFDEIFATPGKVLAKVADRLGLPLPADFDQRVHQFSSEHLDPSLRHSVLPREDVMLEPDLPQLVAELYRVLLDAAQSQNVRKTAKFVAYAERQVESLTPHLADYDAKQTRLASLQTESNAAKAECIRLQSQLTDHSQQNHVPLIVEREELAARLASLESEHSDLVTRHTALATALEELQSQHSSIVAERDGLVAEREALQSDHSSLTILHSSIVAERDALASQHATLQSARDEAATRAAELEDLRHELVARQAMQSETQAKLTAAEQNLKEAQSAHEKAEADAKDTIEENELLLSQLRHVQKELERYFLENRELKQQHEHLATSHASLVVERDDLAARHSSLATALEQLQGQHSSLVAERDTLITRITDLASEHSHLSALQAELIAERNNSSRRIKERDGATRERDEFAARLVKLECEYHVLTKSEHSLKISYRKLEERFASASAALALLKNAHDEAASLRSSLTSLKAEKDEVAKSRDHLTARISTLNAEHSDLVARHKSLSAALEQLQGQHSSLSILHSSLIAERDGLSTRLTNLETENAALTNALDSAQSIASRLEENVAIRYRELAILARELAAKDEALKDAKDKAIYRGSNGCQIASIELMDSVERPPHNHLNVLLRHLQVGPIVWPSGLRIRLVEHHGRPGLVVFESPGEAVPLQHWTRSGEENGIPFFLIVPEDESGKEFFLQAPPTDIYFIYFLAESLESELHKAAHKSHHPVLGSDSLHAWAQIAASMRKLLEIECSRFRHGAFTALAVSLEKNTELIKVDLRDCLYGGRFLPRISFTWDVATELLNFERGENPTLPFLDWPMTRNGSAVESVDASFLRKPLKDRAFRKGPLGSHDEGLVLALAQSLPGLLVGSSVEASLAKARKFVSHVQRAACVQLTPHTH